MPLTPGLSPSLRQISPEPEESKFIGDTEINFDAPDEDEDRPEYDEKGNILRIEHPDGSITVSLDGRPVEDAANDDNPEGWFDNLVDKIDDLELNRIADDLLRGVEEDITSRNAWIQERASGLKLLGLQVELPGTQGTAEGAPVEGMSRVRHPMLLEAVLRFQANARSELLPTDGPVKIREDNNNANLQSDQLGNALELDMNHYLTSTATEYYPDTDRMLFMLGFGGSAFKKVYFCPLRQRPVSESVDADDLIVNNAATDLGNAKRITHRIMMRSSTVKRMQILGVYKDVDLSTPMEMKQDSVRDQKKAIQGITPNTLRPDDRDREIYEIYCELDIQGFQHKHKGRVSGLEIPYRVTIDLSSRKVLSVVRNYDEETKELPKARQNFVNYVFVPGLGFYGIGLLHILGNTTNAVTAAWREMLDAGMFSSFPGFLLADTGARQNTNIFRVPPGGGALVKTGGMPIAQAVMPLPYKEPSQALMALVENMAQTGMRIGGTSEMQVGEGRPDAPVGTTLAMIEQATKVLNSVHKRMHAAQAQEFNLLVQCFKENPESFWQTNNRPAYQWDEKTFLDALEFVDGLLVPQADPNTASHAQRVMKIMALKQLQASNPTMYDPIAVDKAALQAIGWNNPEQFMAPMSAQGKPPPELQQAMAKAQVEKQDADTKAFAAKSKAETDMIRAQAEMAKVQQQAGLAGAANGQQQPQMDPNKVADLQLRAQQLAFQKARAVADDQNRDLDRQADVSMEKMRLESDSIKAEAERAHQRGMQADQQLAEHIRHAHELAASTTGEGTEK